MKPTIASHGWQVAGVVAIGAGLGALAYGFTQLGLIDLVSTATSAFILAFIRLTYSLNTDDETADFAKTRRALADLFDDWSRFATTRPIAGKVILAAGYAAVFVLLRAAVGLGLGLFASFWIAAGIGALAVSAVAAPHLWRSAMATLTRKAVQ